MKFTITFLFAVAFSLVASSQEINWVSWQEMVELQKTERKKVFVDVYTDWCGWCKRMDATTFKDPDVVKAMNANFYAVKLDAEMADSIKHNGVVFVNPAPEKKRSVHMLAASLLDSQMSYPSFVILDENFTRNIVITGYQQVPEMLGNLLFFGTNQHVRLQQYQQKMQQAAQQAQQTSAN